MPVSSRAASRRAGAFTIRRTVQPDVNIAPVWFVAKILGQVPFPDSIKSNRKLYV